jgi:hypothetical protein
MRASCRSRRAPSTVAQQKPCATFMAAQRHAMSAAARRASLRIAFACFHLDIVPIAREPKLSMSARRPPGARCAGAGHATCLIPDN